VRFLLYQGFQEFSAPPRGHVMPLASGPADLGQVNEGFEDLDPLYSRLRPWVDNSRGRGQTHKR